MKVDKMTSAESVAMKYRALYTVTTTVRSNCHLNMDGVEPTDEVPVSPRAEPH